MDYREIQKIRKILLDEVASGATVLSVEHLQLVEMRVQTIVMAKLTFEDIKKEEKSWQKK